jgi:hypothetical protein
MNAANWRYLGLLHNSSIGAYRKYVELCPFCMLYLIYILRTNSQNVAHIDASQVMENSMVTVVQWISHKYFVNGKFPDTLILIFSKTMNL